MSWNFCTGASAGGDSLVMQIVLNGKKIEIPDATSIQKLLEDLKIKPQMVACEVNSKIVRKNFYTSTQLSEGDRVEILQMIGGG